MRRYAYHIAMSLHISSDIFSPASHKDRPDGTLLGRFSFIRTYTHIVNCQASHILTIRIFYINLLVAVF